MKRKILAVGCVILVVIAGCLIYALTPHMKLGEPNPYEIEEIPDVQFDISEESFPRWPVKFDYVIENHSDYKVQCNEYGELQYQKDGVWYTVEMKDMTDGWEEHLEEWDIAHTGESILGEYDSSDFYRRLPSGNYRFVKPVFWVGKGGRHWISAEFTIA